MNEPRMGPIVRMATHQAPGVPPPSGLFYFVVVPNNGVKEGSYGRNSSNVETPPCATCQIPSLTLRSYL